MKAWLIVGLLTVAVTSWTITRNPGTVVKGEVLGKREAFEMPGGDRYWHIYEITYRYRQAGAPIPSTGYQRVDPSLYRRLRIGSQVSVRYRSTRLVGSIFGAESSLEDTSWLSRIPFDSEFGRESAEVAGLVVVILMGFLAYRRKTRSLGMVAGLAAGTWVSAVLLAGFFVFPILFWAWRRNRGQGFGWLLLGTMASTTAALYWRIPQPTPVPSGPMRDAAGVVHHMRIVHEIWTSDEGSQDIRHPFKMVDVEFTPQGAREPIHILDRVDLDSVPGLREGAEVRVSYPVSDPSTARIAGGTRTYPEKALTYLLVLTYGLGALTAFVFCPAIFLVERIGNRYLGLIDRIPLDDIARKVPGFPPDDPRRKALEAFIRSQRNKQG